MGLAALETTHPNEAEILRLRFIEEQTGYAVAARKHLAEGTIFRWQKDGVEILAALLWQEERDVQLSQQSRLLQRLPAPTYTRLFGIDSHCDALAEHIRRPGPPWLLSIEAIGGTGKTALADALSRHLIRNNHIRDFAWATARQTGLNLAGHIQREERPALTVPELVEVLAGQLLADAPDVHLLSLAEKQERLATRLREQPHLLVIDNLETHTDVSALLAVLRSWANPTKILLTTRHSLLAEADVHRHRLTELGQDDALALLRHEASQRNLADVAQAEDPELTPIFERVGGNPLALRLVVGQLHVHGLEDVLADLRSAHSSAVANLYAHIYRRAWDDLNDTERTLLLAMPLVPEEGQPLEEIGQICGLPPDALRDSLTRLVDRNLIDAQGGWHSRRYAIHSLTRSFLREQVLKW